MEQSGQNYSQIVLQYPITSLTSKLAATMTCRVICHMPRENVQVIHVRWKCNYICIGSQLADSSAKQTQTNTNTTRPYSNWGNWNVLCHPISSFWVQYQNSKPRKACRPMNVDRLLASVCLFLLPLQNYSVSILIDATTCCFQQARRGAPFFHQNLSSLVHSTSSTSFTTCHALLMRTCFRKQKWPKT